MRDTNAAKRLHALYRQTRRDDGFRLMPFVSAATSRHHWPYASTFGDLNFFFFLNHNPSAARCVVVFSLKGKHGGHFLAFALSIFVSFWLVEAACFWLVEATCFWLVEAACVIGGTKSYISCPWEEVSGSGHEMLPHKETHHTNKNTRTHKKKGDEMLSPSPH